MLPTSQAYPMQGQRSWSPKGHPPGNAPGVLQDHELRMTSGDAGVLARRRQQVGVGGGKRDPVTRVDASQYLCSAGIEELGNPSCTRSEGSAPWIPDPCSLAVRDIPRPDPEHVRHAFPLVLAAPAGQGGRF